MRIPDDPIAAWNLLIERTMETETSWLCFGTRDGKPVVLKVARYGTDERNAAAVLLALRGPGVVELLESDEDAVLLEHLRPGGSLVKLVKEGRDLEAVDILCDVITRMAPVEPDARFCTVEEWGQSFADHHARGASEIPRDLVAHAATVYSELCRAQRSRRLLHGDLHHDNVLLDARRGWVAIDPKGVAGELEYEIGASLRNPVEHPEVFTNPAVVTARIERFRANLGLDPERMLAWTFAQAVLAAVWAEEDGERVAVDHPWIRLAQTVRARLSGSTSS